jgi:CheY-like chemotaxis protein
MLARHPFLLIVESRNTLFLQYAESIRAAGVHVEHVPHDQAIAKITRSDPDVVLTDGSSETRDAAMGLCQALAKSPSGRRMFVLASSADGNPTDPPFAIGCTLLAEPCPPERLLVEIVRAADRWTIEGLEQILGHLLREHADLAQRSAALEQSALLWADWFERVAERAKRAASGAAPPNAEADLYGGSRPFGVAG